MDTGRTSGISRESKPAVLLKLMRNLLDLHLLGFRMISFDPDTCVGRTQDQGQPQRFNTKAGIVLYRKL